MNTKSVALALTLIAAASPLAFAQPAPRSIVPDLGSSETKPLPEEAMPAAEFKAEEGVKLADRYCETSRELKRLEKLLQDLRELIIAFANQQGVKVLQGSGVRVSVSTSEYVVFPEDVAERPQLEMFLRKAGKWEEVAVLSTAELRRVLADEAWPLALLEKLGSFVRRESRTTLRVQADDETSSVAE